MRTPLISVVIPSFNQADFVGEAIQSVLDQTYSNYEVIVVNDASPDHTSQVVQEFDDPRVKLINHRENLGLPATRNTGIRESTGEFIALLDADDYFHPEKLYSHALFLREHPEIGATYNGRFDLNHSSKTIRRLWRPPLNVNLKDFILGFPFSPSDLVLRRNWLFQVGLFDESYTHGGEDTDLPCRLALAGCRFTSLNRTLNYRRYHSGRSRKNLPGRLEDVQRALNRTFSDPRCPVKVLALREIALKHHLMVLVSLAFIQEETILGQKYLHKLVLLDRSVLRGVPCELIQFLLGESIADEYTNHEEVLKLMIDQFPPEMTYLADQYDWAAARGYLEKGTRAIIWDRLEDGRSHFSRAKELRATIDKSYLQNLSYDLSNYEEEFGESSMRSVLLNLEPYIAWVGNRSHLGWLYGNLSFNKAFKMYHDGQYNEVPFHAIRSVLKYPGYFKNRGLLSIVLRSLEKSIM